jgi:alkylation response protein AidB-like acyl-CoA dehydrogenase
MRLIGQAERAIASACARVEKREVFGRRLAKFDNVLERIGEARAKVEVCRLLVYQAAQRMDELGNKDAQTRQLLSLVKAYVPRTITEVVDACMQMWGAKGFSQDTPLWSAYAGARWLRMADGPDEVHWRTAARIELQLQRSSPMRPFAEFKVDNAQVFRKSTDPISNEAQKRLQAVAKL